LGCHINFVGNLINKVIRDRAFVDLVKVGLTVVQAQRDLLFREFNQSPEAPAAVTIFMLVVPTRETSRISLDLYLLGELFIVICYAVFTLDGLVGK
jgi:hypothetical protein